MILSSEKQTIEVTQFDNVLRNLVYCKRFKDLKYRVLEQSRGLKLLN